MVNNPPVPLRTALLELLRDDNAPCSGEKLGGKLGISRVAVHKHIKVLRENGYSIRSNSQGYVLEHPESPNLSTWEFEPGEHIRVAKHIDSTMDGARRWARRHPDEDFTLAALSQTSGRGRRNRIWESPDGGLWVTRWMHPGGSALRIQLHIMAAALVLARLLQDLWNLETKVKWPNDVMVDGRKIAGVLGEAEITGDRVRSLALGLGLNVNNEPIPGGTSLKQLLGHETDRKVLLKDWISQLDRFLASKEFIGSGEPRWFTSIMAGIGEPIRLDTVDGPVSGRVKGVDEFGRLRVENPPHTTWLIAAGDISS